MATPETKDLIKQDVALFGSLKNEKDRNAAIDKMEIGASDTTLARRIAVFCWALGAASTGNAPMDVGPYVKAFNAKHRGGTTGRVILTEKSAATMVSFYQNFSALGFVKGWKTETALGWILDNVKGEYSIRGPFIKAVCALEAEPNEAELATLWKDMKKKPKLDGRAIAMAKSVKDLAKEGTFIPTLRDNPNVKVAYQKFVLAAAAFEAAVKSVGAPPSEGEEDALAEIMADAA